jgi:hypothetical protein
LKTPGIRVPLTAEAGLFGRATEIGRRVLWLHSYGQRLTDPHDDRPKRPPRLPHDVAPRVLAGCPIPSDSTAMPDTLRYDAAKQELHVGAGTIGNVTFRMWSYDVSGVNVLTKWFSYRRKNRERPVIGDRRTSQLQAIHLESWPASYTSELVDLLNVLGLLAELEPAQADLLTNILDHPLVTAEVLADANVLPVRVDARKPPKHVGDRAPNALDLGL